MKLAKILPQAYQRGIKAIDNQHTEILQFLEEALDASKMSDHTRGSVVDDILLRMSKYSANHFSYEEKFMTKIDYPHLKDHLEQHVVFDKFLSDFHANKNHNSKEEVMNLAKFLKEWFLNHINVADREYADFYNNLKAHNKLKTPQDD